MKSIWKWDKQKSNVEKVHKRIQKREKLSLWKKFLKHLKANLRISKKMILRKELKSKKYRKTRWRGKSLKNKSRNRKPSNILLRLEGRKMHKTYTHQRLNGKNQRSNRKELNLRMKPYWKEKQNKWNWHNRWKKRDWSSKSNRHKK